MSMIQRSAGFGGPPARHRTPDGKTVIPPARHRTPDGKTVTAPLPPGVDGHFGPELRRLVLALYHQGQVTVARLVTLLRGFGILISKRQVVRLLIDRKQNFRDEARDVNNCKRGVRGLSETDRFQARR
jgi:hypothetical protein